MLGSRVSGIFAPMLACLWADTVKLYVKPGRERAFVKDVQQSRGCCKEFISTWGFPPHPSTLMRDRWRPASATLAPDNQQALLRRPASSGTPRPLRRQRWGAGVLRRPASAGTPKASAMLRRPAASSSSGAV